MFYAYVQRCSIPQIPATGGAIGQLIKNLHPTTLKPQREIPDSGGAVADLVEKLHVNPAGVARTVLQDPGVPNTNQHIFISYCHSDKEIVYKINKSLKARGHQVWIDSESMRGNILEGMAQAVERSWLVLLCISKKYQESKNCRTGNLVNDIRRARTVEQESKNCRTGNLVNDIRRARTVEQESKNCRTGNMFNDIRRARTVEQEIKNCRTEAEYTFQQGKNYVIVNLQPKFKPNGWLGALLGTRLYYDFSGSQSFDEMMQVRLAREIDDVKMRALRRRYSCQDVCCWVLYKLLQTFRGYYSAVKLIGAG
ncbi:hypothetical protein Btru_032769 [Bulinus truncatus]|nr:hypothetical protein Btru_032769 [Bulinus truncatus]